MKTQKINEFRNTLRTLEKELDAKLKEGKDCHCISLVQCHLLLELKNHEETNIKALSSCLELDKSTVSRSIDLLVKQGLVSREIDRDNRRFVLLSLSEKGKKTCKSIDKICDDYYIELFKHIPEEKRDQVLESLSLFTEALIAVNKKEKFY